MQPENNDSLINVGLYGDGSRNAPLRAEYVYCDRHDECSAFKNGLCFCVTFPFGHRCPVGRVITEKGGTKRANKYCELKSRIQQHEKKSKLQYPGHTYITRIGNEALFTIPFISLVEMPNYGLSIGNPSFGNTMLLLSKSYLNPANINRLCTFKPRALFGGDIIKDYQNKIVPMLLLELAQKFPEEYQEYLKRFPQTEVRKPDWTGRRAKLATCNRDETYYDYGKNAFRFDGDYVVCDQYHFILAPFKGETAEIRMKVADNMEVTITDNNQVTENTVFL